MECAQFIVFMSSSTFSSAPVPSLFRDALCALEPELAPRGGWSPRPETIAEVLRTQRRPFVGQLHRRLEEVRPGLAAQLDRVTGRGEGLSASPVTRLHRVRTTVRMDALRYLYWARVAGVSRPLPWSVFVKLGLLRKATEAVEVLGEAPGLIERHSCSECAGSGTLDLRCAEPLQLAFRFSCAMCRHEARAPRAMAKSLCRCAGCRKRRASARREFARRFPLALAGLHRAMRVAIAHLDRTHRTEAEWDRLLATVLARHVVGERGHRFPKTLQPLRALLAAGDKEFWSAVQASGVTLVSRGDRFFVSWQALQYVPLDHEGLRVVLDEEAARSSTGS
ncbi:MAG: hypothetical protein HY901_17205 [Deltaproteobacteria bacterium]|nr:hypothetical protein [Deltaproteobacteria bacterium]